MKAEEVVPYVGTWIEIDGLEGWDYVDPGRSLRGNVDRNTEIIEQERQSAGRSLRGNVDRNS